ncbi:MAG: hypothetical protein KDB02_13350 [Acidimicrobiales bacterium]|nr:hypothetical protein [Acidimicrobiales bacterium]
MTVAAFSIGLLLVGGAAACSKDEARPGFGTARAVVDAHVAANRDYDLAGDCELRSPEAIDTMASADGREADGYCEWATSEVVANATPSQRARTTSIYSDPKITAGTATADRATFTLMSKDGSYREEIDVVRVDGRWYLESARGTDTEHGDGHDH